jgi:hypothetical protein
MIRPTQVKASTEGRARWMAAGLLALSTLSTPALASAIGGSASPVAFLARYDPQQGETLVQGKVAPGTCLSFKLRDEWSISAGDGGAHVLTGRSGAAVELRVRQAEELGGLPQHHLAERDAAILQRTYEDMIGKPVQAVAHASTAYRGVSRWSATWIDGNLDSSGHALTIEAFIVETGPASVMEMSLTGFGSPETYEAEVGRMLGSLNLTDGRDCRLQRVSW